MQQRMPALRSVPTTTRWDTAVRAPASVGNALAHRGAADAFLAVLHALVRIAYAGDGREHLAVHGGHRRSGATAVSHHHLCHHIYGSNSAHREIRVRHIYYSSLLLEKLKLITHVDMPT